MMRPSFSYVYPVTREQALEVGRRLRPIDREECSLSQGGPYSPEMVAWSVEISDFTVAAVCGGVPLAVFGGQRLHPGSGSPLCIWALGTDAVDTYRREFLAHSREAALMVFERLGGHGAINEVLEKNAASIRWLEWLGAKVDPHAFAGQYGGMWRGFTLRLADLKAG